HRSQEDAGPIRRRLPRTVGESGASLVEFALIIPLFVLLLFGLIDFGWAYTQYLDVKSGAREGARLAIVDAGTGASKNAKCKDIQSQVKSKMSDSDSSKVTVILDATDSNGNTKIDVGEPASITVQYPKKSLTGVTSIFLSGDMHSTVIMRMEQVADWSTTNALGVCQ